MQKNQPAWNKFLRETNTLEKILSTGFAEITAEELKRITGREPRLLAKLDTLESRPQDFRENDLSILPIENGKYILFRDTKCVSYYRFSEEDLDLPVNLYSSIIDLNNYDTFPGFQNLSESQAIDFAYISSLLRFSMSDEGLKLVLRGRAFSGKFDFILPEINHKVKVSGVQIEIDAGFESDKKIYLLEAKIGKRSNFNIRQLYYPYLNWLHRSKKDIVSLFLDFSNSKYYLYEFSFTNLFGDVNIISKQCYVINESPLAEISITSLLRITPIGPEPNYPFPQANDLDKVVDLITYLNTGMKNKREISEYFEFDERQGDYYANAGCYLGYIKKEKSVSGDGFSLTALGKHFLNIQSSNERTRNIIVRLIEKPSFNKIITLLVERGYDLKNITDNEISSIIENITGLGLITADRRASTARNWLHWLLINSKILLH